MTEQMPSHNPSGGRRSTASRSLVRYSLRRLAVTLPLLLALTFVTFMLLRVGSASPATLIAGPMATESQIAQIEDEMGLDRPLLVQYGIYMTNALRGNLGDSWITNRPVTTELRERLPETLQLWFLGMLFATIFGVGLGTFAAFRRNRVSDHGTRIATLFGLSMPIFWMGLILIFVFFVILDVAPAPFGRLGIFVTKPPFRVGTYLVDSVLDGNWDAFQSAATLLILPVATIAFITGATIAKQTRTAVIEALGSPAIRYARGSGVPSRTVSRMALHLASPGIVTYIAIAGSLALGGTALVELVFSWGGYGQLALDAMVQSDFSVVQAFVLAVGAWTVILYFVSDVVLAAIDPRVTRR